MSNWMRTGTQYRLRHLAVDHQRRGHACTADCSGMFISENLKKYVVSLTTATGPLKVLISSWRNGSSPRRSPRATMAMIRCAKALAWLRGDDCVSSGHIHSVAAPNMRHRIFLRSRSEADGISRPRS